jgi:quinol monooxygenase YgiN
MTEITKGLIVQLEAKSGRERELERFLIDAQPLVEQEPGTVAWFAFRTGPTSFGIFDVFPGEAERNAHLSGPVAAALLERADDLLAAPPQIVHADALVARMARDSGSLE